MFDRNLAQSTSHLNFWLFSVISKYLPNLDVNIKQVSFFKSSKFNGFLLALLCIVYFGKKFCLENVHLCALVVFPTN